jgi:hypothetical protein
MYFDIKFSVVGSDNYHPSLNLDFKLTFDCVRFQVLTAASMKMTVFSVAASCSLVEIY